MNKLIKKVLVGITAATMMFGSVCTAYAATDSATVAPAPEKQTNVKADNGAKVSTAANGTATVKALPKTTKKSVTVASKVVVDGVSYKVTAIGAKAFANATKATTVTLPASIKTIGAQAFTGAKSVKTIVIKSASVKVAGDNFDQAIMSYVRKNHSLFIGEEAAENIKIKIGTACQEASPRMLEVKGRNVITGLPKVVTLTSEEIRIALRDATNQIVETVHGVLEKTPPELAADIVDRGIVLTGGGALLHGMDTLIEQKTGVSTLTVQDAMSAVVVGTGKYAEVITRMEE